MSRTLFWYVFKDLLKIFFMASGALAGIMSFGGLLRPLTQNGLGGQEVFKLLSYFMPAMSTYSLPVAALFATTVVYGRMAADNEQTACRASGISFLSMAAPAMLLGLLVAIGSMFLLCFTVPNCTMKIERLIYSNLARIIAHEIERSHETTHLGTMTVFAESAELPPGDPKFPNRQSVVLRGPLIVSFYTPPGRERWYHVAKDFYTAKTAVLYVDESPDDDTATLTATMNNGLVFPRRFFDSKSRQGGMETGQFGPVEIPSQLGEKTKFMDIFQLKSLEKNPARGHEVKRVTAEFIQEDQSRAYCNQLAEALRSPAGKCVMRSGVETYVLASRGAQVVSNKNALLLTAPSTDKPVQFRQESSGQVRLSADARSVRLIVEADTENDQFIISVELKDALVDAGDTPNPQAEFSRRFVLTMPPEIAAMKTRTTQQYLAGDTRSPRELNRLLFAWVDLINHIRGEMHARAAFVVSCLLLVLMGAALGMMFKSGNFLTAFAVSVVPAMFSTVLIVTGQHTAEATPQWISAATNPLTAGITLIWMGNVVICAAAIALFVRLQRH